MTIMADVRRRASKGVAKENVATTYDQRGGGRMAKLPYGSGERREEASTGSA